MRKIDAARDLRSKTEFWADSLSSIGADLQESAELLEMLWPFTDSIIDDPDPTAKGA